MDIYATLWATLISSTTSIIQLLYNHCEWNIQCPVRLAESFVIVGGGLGEGWTSLCLISPWHWPHSLSSDTSGELGSGRGQIDIIKNQRLRQPLFFSTARDFWIEAKRTNGVPETSASQTVTLPGCIVATRPRTDGITLTQAIWDHPNVQLWRVLSLLFSFFLDPFLHPFSPSTGYICDQDYRSLSFTSLRNFTDSISPPHRDPIHESSMLPLPPAVLCQPPDSDGLSGRKDDILQVTTCTVHELSQAISSAQIILLL